jgi:hypothetical protein
MPVIHPRDKGPFPVSSLKRNKHGFSADEIQPEPRGEAKVEEEAKPKRRGRRKGSA